EQAASSPALTINPSVDAFAVRRGIVLPPLFRPLQGPTYLECRSVHCNRGTCQTVLIVTPVSLLLVPGLHSPRGTSCTFEDAHQASQHSPWASTALVSLRLRNSPRRRTRATSLREPLGATRICRANGPG